jgi:hypothetical protein
LLFRAVIHFIVASASFSVLSIRIIFPVNTDGNYLGYFIS